MTSFMEGSDLIIQVRLLLAGRESHLDQLRIFLPAFNGFSYRLGIYAEGAAGNFAIVLSQILSGLRDEISVPILIALREFSDDHLAAGKPELSGVLFNEAEVALMTQVARLNPESFHHGVGGRCFRNRITPTIFRFASLQHRS